MDRLFKRLVGHHSSKGRSRAEAEHDGYHTCIIVGNLGCKYTCSIPCGYPRMPVGIIKSLVVLQLISETNDWSAH